jgi:hypothetical protein
MEEGESSRMKREEVVPVFLIGSRHMWYSRASIKQFGFIILQACTVISQGADGLVAAWAAAAKAREAVAVCNGGCMQRAGTKARETV